MMPQSNNNTDWDKMCVQFIDQLFKFDTSWQRSSVQGEDKISS